MSKARDIADLDFNSPDIDGGNIDGATIGGTTPAAGSFSGLNVNYSTQATANQAYGLIVNGNDSGSSGDSGSIFIGGINNTVRGAFIAAEIQSSANNHDLIFGVSGPSASPTERLRIASTGAATFNGTVETGGTLYIPQWIEHSGDSNTYFGFPSGDQFKIVTGNTGRLHITGSESVWNEGGEDKDFRVESDGNANMLFVDGGANHVNIGTSDDYGGKLNVNDSIYVAETDTPRIRLRNIGNSDTELGVNGLGAGLDTFYIAQYAGLAANEWDFRLTGASREFAFIRGGVVNEGAGDSDFRVESVGDSSMLHVDAGNNEVGIGTSSPENRMEIRDNNASTNHARGLTITNFSLTANSRAGIIFKNYDNHGASIYSPRTGSTQGKLVLATNTGYNTTEASTDPKLVILYAGGTEQYAAVNDARWFTDSSAFSNPTTDLFTGSTTGANYPQTCFEVTMYGNGVSANEHQVFKGGGTFDYSSSSNGTAQNLTTYTNYHVGNALPAAPTFALSGNILQMTSYRQTNYDTYRIEVRVWGRNTTQAWGTHQ